MITENSTQNNEDNGNINTNEPVSWIKERNKEKEQKETK